MNHDNEKDVLISMTSQEDDTAPNAELPAIKQELTDDEIASVDGGVMMKHLKIFGANPPTEPKQGPTGPGLPHGGAF
jgi:hypothetical protein